MCLQSSGFSVCSESTLLSAVCTLRVSCKVCFLTFSEITQTYRCRAVRSKEGDRKQRPLGLSRTEPVSSLSFAQCMEETCLAKYVLTLLDQQSHTRTTSRALLSARYRLASQAPDFLGEPS